MLEIKNSKVVNAGLVWIDQHKSINLLFESAKKEVDKFCSEKSQLISSVDYYQKQVDFYDSSKKSRFEERRGGSEEDRKEMQAKLSEAKNQLYYCEEKLVVAEQTLDDTRTELSVHISNRPAIKLGDLSVVKRNIENLNNEKKRINDNLDKIVDSYPSEVNINVEKIMSLKEKYNQIAASIHLGDAKPDDIKSVERELEAAQAELKESEVLERDYKAVVAGLRSKIESINQLIDEKRAVWREIAIEVVTNLNRNAVERLNSIFNSREIIDVLSEMMAFRLILKKANHDDEEFSRGELKMKIELSQYSRINGFSDILISPDAERIEEVIRKFD